jgi:hypothetical protein
MDSSNRMLMTKMKMSIKESEFKSVKRRKSNSLWSKNPLFKVMKMMFHQIQMKLAKY